MNYIEFRFIFRNGNNIKYSYMTLDEILDISFPLEFMIDNLNDVDAMSDDFTDYELIDKDQFTGFKDKNDVKIYKNDIVHIPFHYSGDSRVDAMNYKVVFNNGSFYAANEINIYEELDFNGIEVIGNIYQYKETSLSKTLKVLV
jgi:hypothetical protein